MELIERARARTSGIEENCHGDAAMVSRPRPLSPHRLGDLVPDGGGARAEGVDDVAVTVGETASAAAVWVHGRRAAPSQRS
jgi:hypothetical protein